MLRRGFQPSNQQKTTRYQQKTKLTGKGKLRLVDYERTNEVSFLSVDGFADPNPKKECPFYSESGKHLGSIRRWEAGAMSKTHQLGVVRYNLGVEDWLKLSEGQITDPDTGRPTDEVVEVIAGILHLLADEHRSKRYHGNLSLKSFGLIQQATNTMCGIKPAKKKVCLIPSAPAKTLPPAEVDNALMVEELKTVCKMVFTEILKDCNPLPRDFEDLKQKMQNCLPGNYPIHRSKFAVHSALWSSQLRLNYFIKIQSRICQLDYESKKFIVNRLSRVTSIISWKTQIESLPPLHPFRRILDHPPPDSSVYKDTPKDFLRYIKAIPTHLDKTDRNGDYTYIATQFEPFKSRKYADSQIVELFPTAINDIYFIDQFFRA